MSQLQNNVKRFIKTHDLSISEASRSLGLSRRTVDRILGRDIDARCGEYNSPSQETITKIAQAFGVDAKQVTKRLPAEVIQSAA